jgi:hypothetical protein
MVLRASGVAATPSRWRSRVQVPSGPPWSRSSAGYERSLDMREAARSNRAVTTEPLWRNGQRSGLRTRRSRFESWWGRNDQ